VVPSGSTTGTCEPPACSAAAVVTPGVAVTGQIYLSDASSFDGTCRHNTASSYGEGLFQLTLTGKSDVTATTDRAGTNFDTVVYVLSTCAPGATELGCDDDVNAATDWKSTVTTTLDPGTYFVVVDMGSPSKPDGSRNPSPDPASYSLLVTTTPVLGLNAACDPAGVANRCDTSLACTDGGDAGYICQ
jgi:hypothetical protein